MSRVDVSLSEVFDVATTSDSGGSVMVSTQPEPPKDAHDDFDFVRDKLHSLLRDGTDAFETLAMLAKSEEKVAAFQALNEMIGKLSDVSMKLLEIQEKKQKATAKVAEKAPTNITNNSVYVGSTAELSKLFNDNKFMGETIDND